MLHGLKGGASLALFLALLFGASPARAERRPRSGAQEMLQAVELIQSNRCDAAIPLLRTAYEVGDLRNALWNLAECYALLGRPRLAIEAYTEYMTHQRTSESDRREAQAAIAQVEAQIVIIALTGNVEGALVRIDGQSEGAIPAAGAEPLAVEVGPGQHNVEVSSPGFRSFTHQLEAGGGQRYPVDAVLELLPGELIVSSEPSGAELWFDGERLGETPLRQELPSGGHSLLLRHRGYRTSNHQIVLRAGQPLELSLELEPLSGTLAVATNAPGATLLVDGDERGQSPFPPISLSPGHYQLEVRADDHGDWQGEVDLVDQRTTRVELELRSTEGLRQGWFWAVAGVTLAAFTSTILLFVIGQAHMGLYEEAATFVERDQAQPLLIAAYRQAGTEHLQYGRGYNGLALILGLVTVAGAVADFFIGLFTRWRAPQGRSQITVEDSPPEAGAAPLAGSSATPVAVEGGSP